MIKIAPYLSKESCMTGKCLIPGELYIFHRSRDHFDIGRFWLVASCRPYKLDTQILWQKRHPLNKKELFLQSIK